MQNDNKAVGPGAIQEQGVAPDPLLQGATEFEVVGIFNPLPEDFIGQVGQTKPVNTPFEIRKDGMTSTITNSENDVRTNYGLNLKNPDHQGRMPIVNYVRIPSGKTLAILGNEAQVIVRQLVNEIMQREKRSLMLADPTARHEVEQRIVRYRRPIGEVLDGVQSVGSQIREGVGRINDQNEQEFPGLTQDASGNDQGSGSNGGEETARTGGTRGRK